MKLFVQEAGDRVSDQQDASELIVAVAQRTHLIGRRPIAKLKVFRESRGSAFPVSTEGDHSRSNGRAVDLGASPVLVSRAPPQARQVLCFNHHDISAPHQNHVHFGASLTTIDPAQSFLKNL